MEEDPRKFFEKNVFDNIVKVELTDSRNIYGYLYCVDKKKNLVLVDAFEEIDKTFVAPINQEIQFFVKNEKLLNKLKDEATTEADKEFCQNKFYLGQAIIPGTHIKKLELFEKKKVANE